MRQQRHEHALHKSRKQTPQQMVSYALIIGCFMLWGFTNDMTGAMVSAFSKIFRISLLEGGLVNVANFLGYFVMAIPAALLIRKYKFKAGVLVGLGVYALGALLFFPSKMTGAFSAFLSSYFIMTCGLAFLETSCHPFVYSLGPEETGIVRLNFAQAFNALGATIGMFIAHDVVQAGMSPLSSEERMNLPLAQFNIIKDHDLSVLIQPYLFISTVIIILMVCIFLRKMTTQDDKNEHRNLKADLREILKLKNYREGVLAEFFYVGAQVACWTFIIQYGTRVFMAEGYNEAAAEMAAQKYNIAAIIIFAIGRFVSTGLLQFFKPGRFLAVMAIFAAAAIGGVMLFTDRNGLYCLVAVSGCMSMMFPTIYGISLRGLGKHIKLASAGLTMSVFGGAVFTALQAGIIQSEISLFGLSSVNLSFVVPLFCFILVALFGHRAYVRQYILHSYE